MKFATVLGASFSSNRMTMLPCEVSNTAYVPAGRLMLSPEDSIVHEPPQASPPLAEEHHLVAAWFFLNSERLVAGWLPAFLFAQLRDVRGVMSSMPRIQKQQPVHRAHPVIRMPESPRKILHLQRMQQAHPAAVQQIQQPHGTIHRRRPAIPQSPPPHP